MLASCGGAVSSVEDPEKMLDQTVSEMQNDLIKMRQASAQVSVYISVSPLCCLAGAAGLLHACMHAMMDPKRVDAELLFCERFPLYARMDAGMKEGALSWRCAAQVMASQKQIEVKYKAAQQAAVRAPFLTSRTQLAFSCTCSCQEDRMILACNPLAVLHSSR